MFKELRKRFVITAMTGMLAVTLLVVGSINGINYYTTVKSIHSMLELISYNGGSLAPSFKENDFRYNANEKEGKDISQPPEPPKGEQGNLRFPEGKDQPYRDRLGINDETPFTTRYFVAIFDDNNNLKEINMDNIAAFTDDEATNIAGNIIHEKNGYGRDGSYYYLLDKVESGSVLIYLDCKRDIDICKDFLLISLLVAVISLVVELIILILLSGKVVKPVVESVEKQKEFITNASHELKTPLTVISASTEVLELTEGKNEWLDSIKNQTNRMTKLVNDMVMLAKLDEEGHKLPVKKFDLSEAVNEVGAAFRVVAEAKNITFICECQEGISYEGDEAAIKQLVSILLDNGVKYVTKEGIIRLSLFKEGRIASLKVFNSYDILKDNQLKHIFDRFYRVDKSRSRQTGGSGIGLSVAKAIVDNHEGMSINVKNIEPDVNNDRNGNDITPEEKKEKGVEFTVYFK